MASGNQPHAQAGRLSNLSSDPTDPVIDQPGDGTIDLSAPVCIAGMHRSGTSMVASALKTCGLHLGDEDSLLGPATDNPDGFWEHAGIVEINDALLSLMGGAWDWPPPPSFDWQNPELHWVRARAEMVVRQVATQQPWGWKDPRSSLTLPFWESLFPAMRVVVVVRNPLEVARSLQRRNGSSIAFGLALWAVYNQRLIDSVIPGRSIVTSFERFFEDTPGELRRLVDFLQLSVSEKTIVSTQVVDAKLRHSSFSMETLVQADVSPTVVDLYTRLCEAAEETVTGTSVVHQPVRLDSDKREPVFLDVGAHNRSFVEAERLRTETEGLRVAVAKLDDNVRGLQRLLAERTAWARTVKAERSALSQRLESEIAARDACIADLRAELDEQARRRDDMLAAFDVMRRSVASLRADADMVRFAVNGSVPPGATILVASKGDARLITFESRHGQHFLQSDDGGYAGYNPENSQEAIAQLQALRDSGASYFVLPSDAFWWLEYYREFSEYLSMSAHRIWGDSHCIIYTLDRPDAV